MELHKGTPENLEGRLEKEIQTYRFLEETGVEFWQVDHEEAATMEACEEIDRALNATICKNLFLCNRQETEFYLLMMPGDKVFKTKDLSAQIGSARLSFAKPEHMLKYLNITPGSVSVLGLMFDKEKAVKLLVDKDILEGDTIGCHPCVNTASLKMKTADMFEKVVKALDHEPQIIELPRYELPRYEL